MADQNPKAVPKIPHHLIFQEILPKLPAKSLIRFKSIALKWNSVISSVKFAKTHLLHHSHLSESSVLTRDSADLPFEAVEFDENRILDSNRYGINIKGLRFLISSCNGLALLISCDRSVDNRVKLPYHLHLVDFAYVIYNPVLGSDHFIEIPYQNDQFHLVDDSEVKDDKYNFGFGYTSSTDDYYIVAIRSPHSTSVIVAHVYSLRSHKWRKFAVNITAERQVAPMAVEFRNPWYGESGILVAETLYWVISLDNKSQYILAYDLNIQDKGTAVPLPETNFGDYFGLCCLNGYLCAWAKNQTGEVVEMWMMTEYQVRKSWTMLFRFQSVRFVCHKFIGSVKPRMVLALANEDELILVDFSCDPPIISDTALETNFEAVSYVPSLVSVFSLIS